MSVDVQFFSGCDHYVDQAQYEIQTCPRCLGTGVYYDIGFNGSGQVVVAQGDIKFQQEVLKILNDPKGSSLYNPDWGSDLYDRIIGSKKMANVEDKIRVIVRQILIYLQNVQIGNNQYFRNMTDEEILKSIDSIQITSSSPTSYLVEVTVTNMAGNTVTQVISI